MTRLEKDPTWIGCRYEGAHEKFVTMTIPESYVRAGIEADRRTGLYTVTAFSETHIHVVLEAPSRHTSITWCWTRPE